MAREINITNTTEENLKIISHMNDRELESAYTLLNILSCQDNSGLSKKDNILYTNAILEKYKK